MRTSLLVATTMLSFAALYAPQALLPLFAASYDVTAGRAALLITGALVPLSIAPLSYGYLLESVSAARVLRGAVLLLAAAVAVFAGMGVLVPGDRFAVLVGLRCGQGLAFPAVFTALMTVVLASACTSCSWGCSTPCRSA